MTRNPSSVFRLLPCSLLLAALAFLLAALPAFANGGPAITATPTSLSGFETPLGTASSQQSFTVNATSLTDNVTVTATGNFEVSTTTATGDFSTTLSLPQSSGSVNTTIYTRIASTAPGGPASGNITLASPGATNEVVTVNGTVSVPTISATPTSLSGFETPLGTASDQQSFTVNATSLTDNVTVTATGNFEVSTTTATGDFSTTLSLPPSSGSVNITIYTRIASTAPVGLASGNITLASTNATDAVVSTTGTVNGPLAIAITGQPIQTRAGSPIIATQPPSTTFPRVTVTSNGTAVANATVTVTVNTGNFTGNSTTNATTDSDGNASFSNLVLTQAAAGYTLTFTANATNYPAGNSTTSVQFPIIAAAAAAATLTTPPGNTTYGSSLNPATVVTLTDLYGNPVSNTNITARLSNNGTFDSSSSNATVRTTTNGTATYSNLVPAQAGNFTITFDPAAGGVPDVTSNITVSPLATTLTIGNATMQAAASLPSDLVVTPAPSFSDTAFQQNDSDILGNFTYTSSNTTAVGNHTLSITPSGNGTFANYAITYNNGTLTVTAGNATSLTELAAPVTTEAGRPIEGVNLNTFSPEPPTIFVGDEFGNPVSGITVNATISTNPGNATLNGTTSLTTDATGNATFNDLVITKSADGYKLTFSATGLTDLVTEEFNIEPASPHDIVVFTQPGNSTAGQLIPGATDNSTAVQVFDEYGNVVNRAYNVEATLLTANFTGNSTTIELTDSTGYGVFDNLTTTQSGTFQIQFAPLAAGNITTTSASFTVDPDFGSANISVSTQPGNSTAGELLAGPPSAQILDQYANPIGNYTVNATLNTGSFSANSTTSNTTDTTGTATLGDLRIETAGNYTLDLAFSETTTANASVTTSNFTVDPAAAAKLVMVTEPSATAQAGIALATQPAVRLQDAFSNNVLSSGTSVSASATGTGNGTAGGNTNATTDGNGTATFAGLSINGTVGDYTLEFSATNLTSVNATTTIALSAGIATQLRVSTEPSSTAMANATFSQQPVVQILDAWSNLVSTDNSTVVAASLNTGGLSGNLSGTANATASGGNSSFSGLAITGQAGNYTLTFNATGLTAVTSNTTEITADLTTANITMGTQPGNSTAGSAINGTPSGSPLISILDQYSNPIGNYTVNATLNGASFNATATTSTGTTGIDGNATFSSLVTDTAGNYTLAFSFNATTPTTANSTTTSANFTVEADVATELVMVQQPSATAQAGIAMDTQPSVRLRDQFGNNRLESGVTVNATVTAGNATSGGNTTATTDGNGTATFSGLSINGTVGDYTLSFSSGSLNATTSNSVTLNPGNATQLSVSTEPSSTSMANATFSQQPVVQILDAWNNLVTTDNSTVVAAALNAGSLSGNLSGTANATASGGNASFSGLAITGEAGDYSLTFSSGSIANATSSNLTITADLTTANITMGTQPGNATAGDPIPGFPSISIRDQYNNPVGNYTVNARLDGSSLTSTSTKNATTGSDGNATFSDLVTNIATTGTPYTLTFSFNATIPTTASNSTTSSSFTIDAAAAAALAITTQPSSAAQAGIALAQQPVIQVKDQFGNNAPASGLVIAATSNGSATANGTTTASTDGNGTASFSGLLLEGTAGNYTLTFGNGSLSSATSNSIALGAGTATKLVVSTQPGNSTAAGTAFSPQPAVGLQDAWNNAVSQGNVTVTAAVTTVNASVGGNNTATSAGDGVALFDGLTIAGQVGDYTLTFNATALADAISDTVAVTANPATAVISISTNATTSIAGQALAGPPAATIVDGSNNPLSGISVTAAINQNSGNFSGTTSVSTNSTGVASFGNLTQTVAASGYNLTLGFNSGNASGNATTANFSVTAAAASNMTVSRQPISTIAGLVIASNLQGTLFPAARLRDAFGNPVVSQNVTVTLQTGNLTGNLTVLTDGTGNATFSDLVCTTAGFYRLAFASDNVSPSTTNGFNIFANAGTTLALVNTLQTTAQAGVVLNPQPVIQIRDNFGNNASLESVSVTVNASVDGISGGSATVLTNGNGTATYSGLLLTGTVGNRTLTFSAAGLTSAVSPEIDLTAGAVDSLIVIVQPSTVFIAGNELRGAGNVGFPTVTVRDAYNNPVSATVNATGVGFTNFGNGSVTSLPTDGNGTVVFTNLMVVEAGLNQRVNFASGNVSANTNTFIVYPGDPVSMAVTAQPPTSIGAGVTLSPNPAVTLYDAFSNTVTSSYDVMVSLGSGNGTLSGTTNMTTTGGVATFTSLSIAQLGNYTLSFRTLGYDPEIIAPASNEFSVVSPTASGLAITSISAVDATTYQIAFTAAQGGDYWIERTTDLTSGVWVYVSGTAETATTGANTVDVTSPGGTKAFWRLTTQQPPL